MDQNLLKNHAGTRRSVAIFVVLCTVLALWSNTALGASDKATSEMSGYERVAEPQQPQSLISKAESNVSRPQFIKKIVDKQSALVPVARQTTGSFSSGFDPHTNGFSFANWTDDPNNTAVGVETLVRVFGPTSVCARIDAGNCVPYRSTTDFVAKLRVALASGRCDGLVVLASRLFQKQSSLTDFSLSATTTADLTVSQVDNEVVYWWTTQVLPTFSTASAKTRTLVPSKLADQIARDIRSNAGSTIGIYSKEGGHSVLPIAIRFKGSLAEIDIYDSNTPGLTQTLTIDRDRESWTYVVRDSAGLDTHTISGTGPGELDLVPLDARRSAPTNYFERLDEVKTAK